MPEIDPEYWISICNRALRIYDREIEFAQKHHQPVKDALLLNRKMWEQELAKTEERKKHG